jgi:7-cyano-7-deazaguanine synthase
VTALVLLSGGLDSTVCLGLAARDTAPVTAVTVDYGQRHRVELDRASSVAATYGVEHLLVDLDLARWGGSALTDAAIAVPDAPVDGSGAIPTTYVPARNLIFCALASGIAEIRGCDAVYLGVNALDYSGYPDCRPEFIEAFQRAAALGLKRGVEGRPLEFRTPLIHLTKAEIVSLGLEVGAPLELTWSCYRGEGRPCGWCDACVLRAKGFSEAGLADPALGTSPVESPLQ